MVDAAGKAVPRPVAAHLLLRLRVRNAGAGHRGARAALPLKAQRGPAGGEVDAFLGRGAATLACGDGSYLV